MVPRHDSQLLDAKLLIGQKFYLRHYTKPRPDGDPDHCSGCSSKFAGFEGSGILDEGYRVTQAQEKGADSSWVWAAGCKALREQVGWSVLAGMWAVPRLGFDSPENCRYS
jgi:hypothetical protein